MFAYILYTYIGILINDSGFVLHRTAHGYPPYPRTYRNVLINGMSCIYMGGKKDKRICCCNVVRSSRRVDAAAVAPHRARRSAGDIILLLYIISR